MASKSKPAKKQIVHRSSITGRFVTEQHTKRNPKTTQTEKR
ncbi:hypothetical protein SRABI70_02834 [Pseudomonas sp. Bi70]|nr:hypothetical protein [Pseudomonas sp. Bi70]CAH0245666.1 hypothetical protein SRABI70_02834 [Pseudomonas sp. Bi70]